MIHAFTSAGPNYLGKVRTLCESIRHHCPDFAVHWLVPDRVDDELRGGLGSEPFDDIVFATELEDFWNPSWLFGHSLVELSTAVKPAMARALLEREDCETVLYFDPDLVLFSALDDLLDELSRATLVLTPHLLTPEDEPEAILDNEVCTLRHGVFNLGFFGVTDCAESARFLTWWHERMLLYCHEELDSGSFTDQKWVNLAPIFFAGVTVLRSPRFNVAPWNATQRTLTGSFDEGFLVDGEELGFYHFTGFDSGAHQQVARKWLPDSDTVAMLLAWYGARTRALAPPHPIPWKLGSYGNGVPIEAEHRRVYRQREDLRRRYPNPYRVVAGEPSFLAWLEEWEGEHARVAAVDGPAHGGDAQQEAGRAGGRRERP